MHPALQYLYACKHASDTISTQGAAAAYGAATRSVMNGGSGNSGKIRHPENKRKQNISPEMHFEASELGHPVSRDPETVKELLTNRLAEGRSTLSKTASAVRDFYLLERIRQSKK